MAVARQIATPVRQLPYPFAMPHDKIAGSAEALTVNGDNLYVRRARWPPCHTPPLDPLGSHTQSSSIPKHSADMCIHEQPRPFHAPFQEDHLPVLFEKHTPSLHGKGAHCREFDSVHVK